MEQFFSYYIRLDMIDPVFHTYPQAQLFSTTLTLLRFARVGLSHLYDFAHSLELSYSVDTARVVLKHYRLGR